MSTSPVNLAERGPPLSLWIVSLALYAFLYAPIAVVIVFSFNAAQHGGPWLGFTTEWYGRLLDSPGKIAAAAAQTAIISM
jgi:spermidine/putrescine transport system permease protein